MLAFDLETGQPVLADVKAMTRRPYKGTMVTIMTSMGRTLRVTADHPVVVYQDQQFAILPASMVVPEDQLMALCELPPVEQATNLNVLALLAGSSLENDVYVKAIDTGFSKQYEQFAAAIPQDMLQFSSEIRQKNHMPLRLFRYLSDMQILDIPTTKLMLYTAKDAATPIKAVLPVDADFLRLCGYYLATGCLFEDKDR